MNDDDFARQLSAVLALVRPETIVERSRKPVDHRVTYLERKLAELRRAS